MCESWVFTADFGWLKEREQEEKKGLTKGGEEKKREVCT